MSDPTNTPDTTEGVRIYLQQRVLRLATRRRERTESAVVNVEMGLLMNAARDMQEAATAEDVRRELQQVLDALQ